MKPKPNGAQNTKFLENERSSLIPLTSSELLKFENRMSVIIKISRFSGHRCPGINEGVFALSNILPPHWHTFTRFKALLIYFPTVHRRR